MEEREIEEYPLQESIEIVRKDFTGSLKSSIFALPLAENDIRVYFDVDDYVLVHRVIGEDDLVLRACHINSNVHLFKGKTFLLNSTDICKGSRIAKRRVQQTEVTYFDLEEEEAETLCVNTRKSLLIRDPTDVEGCIRNATVDVLRTVFTDCFQAYGSSRRKFCEEYQVDNSNFSKWMNSSKSSVQSENAARAFLYNLLESDKRDIVENWFT